MIQKQLPYFDGGRKNRLGKDEQQKTEEITKGLLNDLIYLEEITSSSPGLRPHEFHEWGRYPGKRSNKR